MFQINSYILLGLEYFEIFLGDLIKGSFFWNFNIFVINGEFGGILFYFDVSCGDELLGEMEVVNGF